MLRLDNVTTQVGDCRLEEISFTVDRGDYFVLLGESGVGKTVLLETIAGLIAPESGAVHIDGRNATNVAIQKRNIGLVYQNHALFPHLSCKENIAYPLKCHGFDKARREKKVKDLAERVGASDLLERQPGTLSQGEAQRIALARALASSPNLLLLDEPLASLDVTAKAGLRSLLRKLHREGWTVVHVTHDFEEAMALATGVAVLENGRISQYGSPEEVFHRPRSRFVAEFVGIRNFFRGETVRVNGSPVFRTRGFEANLAGEVTPGPGSLILKSEDIVLSLSCPEGSARNCFKGAVREFETLKKGVEVTVDIGVEVFALVTRESIEKLELDIGKDVWISFKATALQFLGEE